MALFETGVFVAYLFALVFFLLCCAFSMLYSHRVLAKVVQWMLNSLVLPSGTRVTFSGVYLAPIGQRIFFQDLTLISRGGVSFTCVDGHISFNLRGYALWNSGYTTLRPYMCHAGLVGTNVEVFYDSVWRNAVVLDSADLAASLNEQSPRSPLGAKPPSSAGEGKRYITVKLLGGDPTQKPSTARLLFRSFFREKRSRAYETAAGSTVVSTDGMTLPVAIAHVRLRMAPSKLKVHLNGLAVSVFHNKGKYDSEVERVLRSVLPEEVRRAREQQQQQQQWGTASGGRGNNAAVPPRPGTAANTEDTVPLSTEELEVLREIQVASSQRLQSVMRFIGSIDFKLRASHVDLGALDALHPFFLQFTFDRADVSYALTASRNPEQDPHRHVVEGSFTQVDLRWVPSDLHAYSSSKKTPQQQLHQPTSAVDNTTSASHMDRLKQRAQMMFFGPSRRTGAGGSEDGPQDHHNTTEMLGGAESALPPGATTMTSRGTESNASSFAGVGGEATASRRQAGLLPSGESPASIAQQYGVLIDGAQLGSMHIVYYWDAPGLHFTSTERGALVPEELPRMGLDVELAVKKLSYGSWSNYSRAQLQAHFFPPLYDALVMSTLVLGKPRPYFGFETSVVFLEACTVHVPFKWRAPAPSPPFGIRDSGQLGHVDLTFDAGATYVFRPTQIHTNPDGQTSVPGTAQGKPPTSRTNIPAATTPTSSPSSTLIGIAESYFRARNVTIRTSLHAYVPEGPSSLLLEATDLQLHYDVLSPQFWHLRSEWNAIVQLHHTTMFYQAEHTSLFTALLADWNHVPYMYSGEPYRSAPLHNRDTAVHRFAPSLGLLEVFFQHGLDVYLNANPENVVLPNTDIASTEHNTYSIVSCDSGTISYSLPSEVYLVAQENENCQPYEVVLHNVKLSSSVPSSHPLTDFCAHHALRVGELSLTGSYVICTPDMSLEQHASRMPTNSTPSMPTLLNQLTMRVNINTIEGSFGFPTIQHLLSSFENLFGSTTIAVQPDEVFRWLHSTGSIPPGNRAAALLQFLQLSEPRGNGVELHVMVSVRDIEAVFAVEPVSNAAPAADGGPSPRPHASTPAAHGIVVMTHEVEFSVASQVSYFEIALTATPIKLKLGSRTQRLYHRATKGGRGASNVKSASHAALERQLSTPSSPRGGGGGGPYSDPLDYSRRSSLNETQFFFGDGSAVPPHYLHHAERSKGLHTPHRPAAGYQSSHHAGGGWCQMEDQYVCVGPITVARVSHVGPPPHRTKFHVVTEASIGSLSCHMSAETSMALAAIVLGAVQQSKAEDPVRKEAMEFAKAAAERSHEAAQLALLDARGGGGGGGSHTRTSSKSVSQDAMDRPYGVSPQLRPSGKPQGIRGHQYRCSIVFDIPDATQTAFERFLEDQHQSADDSVDLGVFCVAAGCDDVRLTMVFPDLGLCHVRLPEGVHMASSTLNDTNSNKRMSVKAPFVSVVLMVPKSATDLGAADAAGELVEVARVATCVCMRESISYPFDGQHGILGHFAQQVEFVKLCDYDHRVGLTLDSVFPRQNTTSAASAVRRNILAAQQQISAASYDTESVLQGQSSVASVVADDVIRTRRGARRLTAAELASIPVPNLSTSAFTAAVERFDQRQNANGTPRSAELSAETDDDSDGELHSLDEHDAASPGKFTQGSKVFWTCGSEHAGGAGGDAAADTTRTAMTLDDGLDNLTDLFSEPGSDANQSGSLEDAVVPPPVPASALRPVLEYYRCHRTFEVHRSHRTLSQYSHGAMLPQLRTTDGSQQRDFSNFHAHLPSIEFILHAEATAQTLSATSVGSPSRHASSSGHKQLPKADAHEHSAPQETPFSFSEDFNEFDASRGDVDGPPLAWANRMVDNNRRSRDGSTTTHYHLETPLAVELFATIEAVRTGLRAGQVLERAWNGAISKIDGALVRESAGVLGAAPERPQQGLDGKQQAKKKKQVSRSRKRNRLKQWSHTDQIVSICVPCIEAKWLSRAAVHDDVLVRPRDARTCTGVYTTTFAGRSLQLVAQKSAPSRRAALGRETIRYGLSVGVSTVAVMVQINYEPTIRVGSLHVDIPLVTYPKHADHIVVAYLTNATLRGKRDFVGEGQGTGCRASIESCATHSTRDVFHFINSLDLDLHLHPDRPNQQQASATPSPSLRHAPWRIIDCTSSCSTYDADGSGGGELAFPVVAGGGTGDDDSVAKVDRLLKCLKDRYHSEAHACICG
ncbi:membrane-associated protein, putative [Bodo saltans]|uniref:Membrane-associated protein, putative n=1 Tax=Bodo saltans TaxID=75058 RepID=A0A0S4JMY0_BODSA|nr:membrane-associated protein, putative [Bodo saltans]|eukprot:CUG91565.1 membrane-associated protein, putative [Bodo saltans]